MGVLRETIRRTFGSASSDRTLAMCVLVRKTYGRDCGKGESSKGMPQFRDNHEERHKTEDKRHRKKSRESGIGGRRTAGRSRLVDYGEGVPTSSVC
jgi:hypothetical protein